VPPAVPPALGEPPLPIPPTALGEPPLPARPLLPPAIAEEPLVALGAPPVAEPPVVTPLPDEPAGAPGSLPLVPSQAVATAATKSANRRVELRQRERRDSRRGELEMEEKIVISDRIRVAGRIF
jgi:hypothetical protein